MSIHDQLIVKLRGSTMKVSVYKDDVHINAATYNRRKSDFLIFSTGELKRCRVEIHPERDESCLWIGGTSYELTKADGEKVAKHLGFVIADDQIYPRGDTYVAPGTL